MKTAITKITSYVSVILLFTSCFWAFNPGLKEAKADDYQVVWEDNFDGNSLNRSIWNVEVNGEGGGNQELQFYCDTRDNIDVSNGTLKIRGYKRSYGGKAYTSGRINTKGKAEFRYGKIEARMKLPSFRGSWPAFWMLGGNHKDIGWPRCGEIDIMEAINTEKFTHGALHWFGESSQEDSGGDTSKLVSSDFDRTAWHTYAIEWTENRMNFMVDDQVFFSDTLGGYKGEFRKEQFIILNLAIGGQWPGFSIDDSNFPQTMEIDYVRVSQKNSEKNIITGSGVTEKRPNLIPAETVNRNSLELKNKWTLYFNKNVVQGSGVSNDYSGYKANISYLGITPKAIRAYINGVDYIPGETYKCSFDITSSIDKNLTVKVVGEDAIEDAFLNQNVSIQKGYTYHFSKDVYIDKYYDGRLDFIIEMGGRIAGEYMDPDISLDLEMKNASFLGKVDKSKEAPQPTTPRVTTSSKPTVLPTGESDNSSVKPIETTLPSAKASTNNSKLINQIKKAKPDIKKAVKKKSAKKIKVTLKKKVAIADGYQVRFYKTKKNAKKNTNALVNKIISKNKISFSITNKSLKKRKKVFVRVRAYKNIDSVKKFSNWSNYKRIKIL